jgi:conjugal transfer pilus assembly protein TraB
LKERIAKIRESISKLDPQTHRKLVLGGMLLTLFILAYGWSNTGKKTAPVPIASKNDKVSELLPDKDVLDKTAIGESRKATNEMKAKLDAQQKVIDDLVKEKAGGVPAAGPVQAGGPVPGGPVQVGASNQSAQALGATATAPRKAQKGVRNPAAGLPPMPLPLAASAANFNKGQIPGQVPGQSQQLMMPQQIVQAPPAKPSFRRIGDIELSTNVATAKDAKDPESKDAKKKVEMKITLPSGSFMKAQLLNGADAPIGGAGKTNPVPVLVRIQTIATLPSAIRMNLKGCFAICDGYGDLATSRANLQVRNISCLDRSGKAVIDQPVEGYLVDEDGKAGLKGVTVWKGSEIVTRAAFAGFLQGIGNGLKTATSNTSLTALGTVTSLGSSAQDIAMAGAGNGIATAADELQKFYMELVHQSLPVVSVGATKQVTLIIMKKAELVLHEVTNGGGLK